jgi:hypothetical protein
MMSETFINELNPPAPPGVINFDYMYLEVTEVRPVREYNYGDDTRQVLDLTVKDKHEDTVHLTLWGYQVRTFSELSPLMIGDKLLIVQGCCRLYNGYKQISTGKIGVITRITEQPLKSPKKGKAKK